MKKYIALLIITVMLGGHALFAQTQTTSTVNPIFNTDNNWEIYGGYGYLTLNTFVMFLGFILALPAVAIIDEIADEDDDLQFEDSGAFNAGINYYFNDHFYAGLTGTYEYFNIFHHSNAWFASIMPELGVQYGWSRFKFYHAAAAGLWLTGGTGTMDPSFAFNVTWLGLKVRPTEHLWLYLESNFGQKGFIQGGVRLRL